VISGAAGETELCVRLVNMVLVGIPRAAAVALVKAAQPGTNEGPIEVLHWDRRLADGGEFQPSQRLIHRAMEQMQSVVFVWKAGEAEKPQFTMKESHDWAFCTPVKGEGSQGWAIYVSGRFDTSQPGSVTPTDSIDLRHDLKFTELVASVLGSLLQVQILQRKQASLGPFFAPPVLESLRLDDPEEVLKPRETDVSVLFCDLRGFSRKSEQSSGDLLGLLQRVSNALGVMTQHILDEGGVVGDFHGDAAMGFWGWPIRQPDTVRRACMAALSIRAEFEAAARRDGHPLSDFRIGLGVATGRAVAGKIGTRDQVKVTVFGPVVNLASRLEGMTKTFSAPILVDEATAEVVRSQLPRTLARLRRVARVKPYGLDTPLVISEILPPATDESSLKDADLAAYEAALDALLAGKWSDAFDLLHQVPARDRVKDFLTVFIAQHNRTPPADWDGVIKLASR
jgi:adenylate cyclase